MRKILLFLVFLPLLLSCEGVGDIGRIIVDESNRCNQYSVTYHTTNNCDNPTPTGLYLTSEEFQRLYDIVGNASQDCVFVSISPKDGSPIRTGYIKDINSLRKTTVSNGQNCD